MQKVVHASWNIVAGYSDVENKWKNTVVLHHHVRERTAGGRKFIIEVPVYRQPLTPRTVYGGCRAGVARTGPGYDAARRLRSIRPLFFHKRGLVRRSDI